MAGSVSFKLRTTETEGLIMYNPGAGGTVSRIALQLLRSHLLIIAPLVFQVVMTFYSLRIGFC